MPTPRIDYQIVSPLTDEIKGIPLRAYPPEAWTGDTEGASIWPGGGRNTFSPPTAYKSVPLIFSIVDRRAEAVASVPFDLYPLTSDNPITDRPEYATIVETLPSLLRLTSSALDIFGRSYWEIARNRVKLKTTPIWLHPQTMTIKTNKTSPYGAIVGFERKTGPDDEGRLFRLEDIVYFHLPNPLDEIQPGIAPVQVALGAAGILYDIGQLAQAYFKRGAIKATLITVSGNPDQEEIERIKSWWQSLLRGIRTAFETIVVHESVKPVVIGSDLKDTVAVELTQQQREDICATFRMPFSMVFSQAANYATALNDKHMFYEDFVIPRCRWLENIINAQLLKPLGIEMEFDPSRLEVMQYAEVQKAEALSRLTGGQAILTVTEARAMLGYDPMEGEATPATPASPPEQPEEVMTTAETTKALLTELEAARLDLDHALETVGLHKQAVVRQVMEELSVDLGEG